MLVFVGTGIAKQTGTITGDKVRVRIKPTTKNSETVGHVNKGDKVTILVKTSKKDKIGSMEDYWYKIKFDGSKKGWAFGHFVKLENSGEQEQITLEKVKVKLGQDELEVDANRRNPEKTILIKKEKEDMGNGTEVEKYYTVNITKNMKYKVRIISESNHPIASSGGEYGEHYNSKVEFYDEKGSKKWAMEKPGVGTSVKKISENGRFVYLESVAYESSEEFEIYDNKKLIFKKDRPHNYTISPSGNSIFFEEEKEDKHYLSYMNLETGEKWKKELEGNLRIPENDKYFILKKRGEENKLLFSIIAMYKSDGSLVWEKDYKTAVGVGFFHSKYVRISSKDKIDFINIHSGKVVKVFEDKKITVEEDGSPISFMPAGRDISPDMKYIAVTSYQLHGYDGYEYICLLNSSWELIWYDEIDIERRQSLSPKFSDNGDYIYVSSYNKPAIVYSMDEILKKK